MRRTQSIPRPIIDGPTSRLPTAPAAESRHLLARARPGLDVIDGGRQRLRFGEFLVAAGAIDREQLFRAMQLQDRHPEVKIGECAAALGFLQLGDVEKQYDRFLAAARRTP
jgi:hypothetical protein